MTVNLQWQMVEKTVQKALSSTKKPESLSFDLFWKESVLYDMCRSLNMSKQPIFLDILEIAT